MSTFTSFAIAGAGLIGSIITDVLLSKGLHVTIFTRDDSKASLQTFKERGAVIAKVDYDDENSLSSALSGVQVVVSTLSAYQIALQVSIARAAKAAGVELFVPGEYGVPTEALFPKKMIRDLLREIDLPSTVFYCGIFSEYLAPYLDFNFAEGAIRVVGSGKTKFSMMSIPDVGRFAGHVLATATKSDLKWATIPFEGDRLSPLEIAALAEKKLGKKMQLEFADYAENKKNFCTDHKAMYTTLIEEGLAVTGTEEEVKSAIAKFYPDWNHAVREFHRSRPHGGEY